MSLFAKYNLDTDVSDSQGNHATGSSTDVTWATSNATGTGYASFNGTSSFIQIPDPAVLGGDTWTISMWINTSSGSGRQDFFSQWYVDTGDWASIGLGLDNGLLTAYFRGNTTGSVSSITGPNVATGGWKLVTLVKESDRIVLYVNNDEAGNQSFNGSIDSASDVILGVWDGLVLGHAKDHWFEGGIFGLRLYSVALSATEIANLYTNTKLSVPAPSTQYPLKTDVLDSIGDYDGTNNGVTFVNDATLNRDVAFFDGDSNNTVHFTATYDLATGISSKYTISMWVNYDFVGGAYQTLFTDHKPGQYYPSLQAKILSNGQLEITHRQANVNASQSATSTGSVQSGQWTNIVFSWAYNTGLDIYIDGSLDSSHPTLEFIPYNSPGLMKFGADQTGGGFSNHFQGKMADFRFWKSDTLDASQVSTLYSDGVDSVGSVAHYTLDTDAQDSFGDNHGTANDITFSDGAAVFDGTLDVAEDETSYIEIGSSSDFRLQSFSVSFWVNPTSATMSAGRNKRWLMSNYGTSGGWLLHFGSTRHITFQEFSGDGSAFRQCVTDTNSGKVKLNEWRHVTVTVEAGAIKIYVNGDLKKTTSSPRNTNIDYTTAESWIGRTFDNSNSGGAGDNFAGSMDDVKFYSGILTDAEVTALYNGGRPGSDSASATVLFNETFATDAGENATVSGVGFDGAANFFHPTDAITITGGNGVGSALNDDNGSYSISMWIKADVDDSSGIVPLLSDYDQNQDAFGFLLTLATNGDIKVETDGTLGVNQVMDTNTGVDVDGSAWNHIFISADNAADNFELYVNNVQKLDLQGTWIGGGFAADNAITLGNTTDPNFQNLVPFQGQMALVEIWDQASTQSEITQYYNDGAAHVQAYEANQSGSMTDLHEHLALELKFKELPPGAENTLSTFKQDGDRTFVSFTTTDAMLTIQDASNYEYTTEDFTVSFWLRPTSEVQGSWAHPFIMDSLGSFGGYYMFQEASVHNTYGFTGNANFQWTDPDPNMVMSVDVWTHITIVRKGTQSKIYINGQLDSTNANDVAATIGWGGSQLMIGHQWIGDLSDFRIWSRALIDSEVDSLYNLALDAELLPSAPHKWFLQSGVSDYAGGLDSTNNGLTFVNDADLNRDVANFLGDGTNFSVSSSMIRDIEGEYTLSLWLKPDSYPDILTVAELFSDAVPNQNYATLQGYLNPDGTVTIRQYATDSSGATYTTTIASLPANMWSHLLVSWSSSDAEFNGLSIYLNGTLDIRNPAADQPPWNAVQNMLFGASQNADGSLYNQYVGRMADLRFWYTALDPSQVATFYSYGVESERTLTLLAHYTFDDLSNSTGNSDYDLVAYDGASVSNGTLLLSSGSGVYPVNEIVTDPTGSNKFSVSMWFKDLANRSEREQWIQFLADHMVTPAGSGAHHGHGNYMAAIFTNDELGVYDEVAQTFESTGFQMLAANYTGWHHLALVHDNGINTFYIDGVQAGVPVSFNPTDVIQVFGSFGSTYLGENQPPHDPQNAPAAELDNIRVYSGLLSASEISDLYTQEAPPTLETGLIAKFDLDTATESIGGHVGVLGYQAPATENPKFISDGTNQYLEICERGQGLTFSGTGLLEDLPHTSSWSFSAWVAIPEYVTNETRINYFGNDAASIFCKGTLIGGGNVISMALENGYPQLWHRKPEHGANTQATVQVPLNTWTHLLVTIEGGPDNVTQGTIRWYVNGQPAGEGFHHPGGWWGVTNAESANQDIVIGGAPVTNAWPAMRFLGSIDDVRVWNRTLTASEAVELYGPGRGAYQGFCPPPAPIVYDTLLGVYGTAATYSLPSPHGGWVAITADGKSYESSGGQDGTWAGPHGIAGSTATATSTRPVIEAGGFWFTTLHGDFQSMYGSNNHIAYANALDTNGDKVLPSHNGWVQMTDDASDVDLPRALYTDGTHAYYTAVNDDSMTGHFANRLFKSSVAVDSSSVPTWTKLNSNSADAFNNVTSGLGPALAIKFGAAHGTKHVWVCKDQNDSNTFGSAHIVVYDMANGEDVINSTTGVTIANVPTGSVNMGKPVYCVYSGAWYVPCKDAILKSTDGGLNWTSIAITFVGAPMQEIDGVATSSSVDHTKIHSIGAGSNGTLIAVGEFLRTYTTPVAYETKGLILRSEDGITWSEVAEHTDPLYDVAVADQGVWMVVGDDNAIGFSDTDGVSWETVEYAEDQNDTPINSVFYGGLLPDAQGSSQPAPSSSVSIPSDCLLFLDASDTNSYDGYGTAWSDLSSEGNDATLVNSPTYNGSDKVFDFAGSNSQYATVGSGFSDFSSGATFFFVADLDAGDNWERLIDFSTGGRSSNANVRNAGSPINVGRTDTGTGMTIGVYDPNKQEISSDIILNNTLASYCVTIDGTNAKFYRNGALQQTIAYSYLPETETRTNNYIGQSRNPNDDYFDGQIGVIGIFDRDLSETEIADLYNHYKPIYNLD